MIDKNSGIKRFVCYKLSSEYDEMGQYDLISFCGIDCKKCTNYKQNMNCQGCRDERELLSDCPTRICANEKGLVHCGDCEVFPCEELINFYHDGKASHLQAYKNIIKYSVRLRLEEEKDYKITENVTREAFWNLFIPACDEHLLLYTMRKEPDFIKELDFVATIGDEIVGNIAYAKAKVIDGAVEHEALTFGPVCVLPKYQGMGIGGMLINHTITLAREMGYKAIFIYGDPEYYKRFGFEPSIKFKITNREKRYPAALQALELLPSALKGVTGVFDEGKAYQIDNSHFDEYDKQFPFKEKFHTKTQDWFTDISNRFYDEG